jgi:cephalosporin hydroxylase
MGDVNQRLFLTRYLPEVDGPILEVGSKDYGNTASFRDAYVSKEYIGVDLSGGKNVDRVIDLTLGTGDLPHSHFALVICCSVLEHVRRPWEMAENLTRLLRPGGAIYVAVPWVWRYHPYPDDYFRFSWRGVAEIFPRIMWSNRLYSTNVQDEFIEIPSDGSGVDNQLAKYVEQRKYLPYLQVHMLGTKAQHPAGEARSLELGHASGPNSVDGAGEQYLRWYYDTNVWKRLNYRGVRILKNVSDLWNYQEIIHERRIEWVIETGTRHGGSALYFADLLTARKAAGLVISVDVDHDSLQIARDGIRGLRLLTGDSASPAIIDEIRSLLPAQRGPLFVILDSDHRKEHVLRELNAYVPLMQPGDYLIVEDTCVNGHPVRPEFGPGPMEAINTFVEDNPAALRPDRSREEKFACTFAPRGYYVRA